MSDELHALIATQPFHQPGLMQIAALLPQDDAGLHERLVQAVAERDALAFGYMACAATLAGRSLNATLLARGTALMPDQHRFASIAWRMEGPVTENLLLAVESDWLPPEMHTMALFVAAAWWQKHGEGELPRGIMSSARKLARAKVATGKGGSTLAALQALTGDAGLWALLPGNKSAHIQELAAKVKDGFITMMEAPFSTLVGQTTEHAYRFGQPMRRSVERVGRNVKCPCGSGRKYKYCCVDKDVERLRLSTNVPGKIYSEVRDDPESGLTLARLQTSPPTELVRLDPLKIAPELRGEYLVRLAVFGCLTELARAFEAYGVTEENKATWERSFFFFIRSWDREAALRMLAAHSEGEAILPKLTPGVRLLIASSDPDTFLQALETEALAALKSDDPEIWQRFGVALMASPHAAIGIFLARSVLPLCPAEASYIFDEILRARDNLNLPPDDEFNDWMDERALRTAQKHDSAAMHEAQDRFEASKEKLRRAQEELARLERELALRKKQERREEAHATEIAAPDEQTQRENRELKAKVERANARVAEQGEQKLASRRLVEKLTLENEALVAERAAAAAEEVDEEGDGEEFKVSGKQPVRLIGFTNEFGEALKKFSPNVGRAAMVRLGRVASGEPSAFDRLKSIVALPGVVEARVADRYRLLFSLEPERVRVVDLVFRPNLDRTIERYKLTGLPAVR